MRRRGKLDPRQILIQKIVAAHRRGGIIDVSNLRQYFPDFSNGEVGVLKTKSPLKRDHHCRSLSDHVAIASASEINKHVGQARIVRRLLVQVSVRVFAKANHVCRTSLKLLRHGFQPCLKLRWLANPFTERVKNLMRIKRQHQDRNGVSVLKPK